ncbi:hypothetical protein [Nostoc commune]|nr:hypothetical protein [Nostoc commune]
MSFRRTDELIVQSLQSSQFARISHLTFHGKSSSLEKAWLFPQPNYQ